MSHDLPDTMRAAAIHTLGPPSVLHTAHRPLPTPVIAELLVRVEAAGINPIDAKTRSGGGVSSALRGFPAVLGNDFSGVVAQAPYEAHPLQPGTEVYGMVSVPRFDGSYAEYIAVSSLSVAPKPVSLTHVEAAGVPLAAMTALGAIRTAGIHEGQRVLIHAGAGGVGHFAVQFAAKLGAEVFTTASPRNAAWLRELGASEVIDYTSTAFDAALGDIDAVIDLIGNVSHDTGTRSLTVLKRGGIIVNVPSGSWPSLMADAAAAGVRASRYKVAPDARVLEEITTMIDAGELSVHIDETFPLEQAAAAHALLEEGHTRGKLVLTIGPDTTPLHSAGR